MAANVEERLRLARPNAGGPTLEATAAARERALAALPARTLRPSVVAMGAALAAATAAALVFALRPGTEVATAAHVRSVVSQTLGSASSLRGVLVIAQPDARVDRWSFALNSVGDLRLTGLDSNEDLAFDARNDVLRFSDGRWFTTLTGFPPPSSSELYSDWMLEREVGSVIAALAAEHDTQVREVEYAGRPSWLLTIRSDSVEREITVDRALGLPVHDVLKNGDTVVGEWRLENLSVGREIPSSTFALEPGPEQEARTQDEGSRRIAPDAIAATAGYAPLVPTWVPDRYRLDHAAVSRSYSRAGTPGRADVVSFVYRRGLEQLTVTMRPHDASGGSFTHFVGSRFCTTRSISAFVCANVGDAPQAREVKLEKGALAGETARVTIDVAVPPTLTIATSKLDVQISGDVDESELTRTANSFEQR